MNEREVKAAFMAEVDRRIATSPARYADRLREWRPLLAAIPADRLAADLEQLAPQFGLDLTIDDAGDTR